MARTVTKPGVILGMAFLNWPSARRQFAHAKELDTWHRGAQVDHLFKPAETEKEYTQLMELSTSPWLGLVVTSLTQTMFLEGVRRPGSKDNMNVWRTWQENGWDAKQIALYRSTFAHGLAFGTALPGRSRITGDKMTVLRAVPATKMAGFYDNDGDDEFPRFTIEAEIISFADGVDIWQVKVMDETATHYLEVKGDGYDREDWTYISYDEHGIGYTPAVRYANVLDLEGRATGEVEPFIPLARRIDQDTFDRLIVQRFGAWKVRYATGIAKPDSQTEQVAQAMRMRVEDMLISTDPKSTFGVLEETQLDGFIKARDADLRDLSALTQTPPHHMLGLSANMQAESLAAAEAGLQRKSIERKTSLAESHELLFRVAAHLNGDTAEARAFDMQARWRDMESRSLVQAAQALGMLATQLKVPVEMLWERIPNWTDTDSARAKELIENGAIDALINELVGGQTDPANPPQPTPADGE